jgi:hypothetical protein
VHLIIHNKKWLISGKEKSKAERCHAPATTTYLHAVLACINEFPSSNEAHMEYI